MTKVKKPVWREYLEAIIIALFLAFLIRSFVFQAFKIPSGSMLDTLLIGDHLLVNKFMYGPKIPFTDTYIYEGEAPKRNDIIVFRYPEDPSKDYIKRIVGVPGDSLAMKNKVLYRNGEKVEEPYVILGDTNEPRRDNFSPIIVPENKYFVLGDNRDDSADSRYWGFVDRSAIHGKAWRLYWSWDSDATDIVGLPRLSRIGQAIE